MKSSHNFENRIINSGFVFAFSKCRKSLSRTSYNFPLKIVRASGQYMYSEEGVEYLDMRNNVHHGQLL